MPCQKVARVVQTLSRATRREASQRPHSGIAVRVWKRVAGKHVVDNIPDQIPGAPLLRRAG